MILVIGATGNIGSEVTRQLVTKGVGVRALVRDKAKAEAVLGTKVQLVEGDLSRPETVAAAMDGADKLFLVTPLHLDQIAMKSAAIQAAKTAGVKHIVMSTGTGAGPDAGVEIGRWHGNNQEEVKATGIAYTFLQPTFFMQNMLMFADTIREQGAFYMPLGDSKVSWVDARDIAQVGVVALTEAGHENKAYPITGGEAVSCAEMAAILSDVLDKGVNYVDVPLAAAKEGMMSAGMPEKLADLMNELYALGPAGHLAYVADTVEAVTGRRPRTFRQFAEDHAAAFKG
ncbi:MAG: SDR family oxidoreductase [Minwuia sp.]|nr:SDR family oxidoreductase [Minwuia sp.]